MTWEWIRFGLTAVCLFAAVFFFVTAAFGVNKKSFGFMINRMHAASIGDTLGLLSACLGVALATPFGWPTVKLIFIVVFMWFTSPVSSHLLIQTELYSTKEHDKTGE